MLSPTSWPWHRWVLLLTPSHPTLVWLTAAHCFGGLSLASWGKLPGSSRSPGRPVPRFPRQPTLIRKIAVTTLPHHVSIYCFLIPVADCIFPRSCSKIRHSSHSQVGPTSLSLETCWWWWDCSGHQRMAEVTLCDFQS